MKLFRVGICAAALAAALSGCVVEAPHHPYYAPAPVVVQVAPPAPQVEVVGVPPIAGQIWIGGAWFWEGGRHVWHPGHWDAPRPGYGWVPHRWEHVGNEWHFHEGHWDRR
jgi:hypothetical protein